MVVGAGVGRELSFRLTAETTTPWMRVHGVVVGVGGSGSKSAYSSFATVGSLTGRGTSATDATFGSIGTLRDSGAAMTGGALGTTAIIGVDAVTDDSADGDDADDVNEVDAEVDSLEGDTEADLDSFARSDRFDATGAFAGTLFAGAAAEPAREARDTVASVAAISVAAGLTGEAGATYAEAGAASIAAAFIEAVDDSRTSATSDAMDVAGELTAEGIVAVEPCVASVGCAEPGIRCSGSSITKVPAAIAAIATIITVFNGDAAFGARSETAAPPMR